MTVAGDPVPMRSAQLVWGAVPLTVVLSIITWLANRGRPIAGADDGAVVGLAFLLFAGIMIGSAVVGAVIVTRLPGHPIGRLLVGWALVYGLTGVLHGYAHGVLVTGWQLPGGAVSNWAAQWVVVPTAGLGAFVLLLFPDGRLPSPRWRPAAWTFAVLVAAYTLGYAVESWPQRGEVLEDLSAVTPSFGDGVSATLWPVFMVLHVVPLGALVVRYRRGRRAERAQIRWLAAAGIVIVLGQLLFVVDVIPLLVAGLVAVGGLFALPVAIGVAILRYRLYAIDRIISRTVTYGIVVAALSAVYAAGVVGLGTAVSAVTGQEGSDLVVAASTLAAVALFRPVRGRVQAVVERHFNRGGHRARQAVASFADGLRDEVDLSAVQRRLVRCAAVAMQPSGVSLWVAGSHDRGGADGDGQVAARANGSVPR